MRFATSRACSLALLLFLAACSSGPTTDPAPLDPVPPAPGGGGGRTLNTPNGPAPVSPTPGTVAPPAGATLSRAYTLVMDRHYAANPPRAGECARATHDKWWVYGQDGKVYPTWHPPVDPASGCSFGHEHGRDPQGSVFATLPLPFGIASEALAANDPLNPRDEDHVGHKVEWENRLPAGVPGASPSTRCDVLTKLHQGTHSADALTNNLHEFFYHGRCDVGLEIHWQALSALGRPGEVEGFCAGAGTRVYQAGTASPLNSPAGIGKRFLPDWLGCVEQRVVGQGQHWAISELWIAGFGGDPNGGRTAADRAADLRWGGAVYMSLGDPSRFVDLAQPGKIGRMIDVCAAASMRNTPPCQGITGALPAWDDPRSPFRGTGRSTLLVDSWRQQNRSGITRWYTTPTGGPYSSEPFPGGTMQQFIGTTNGLIAEYYGEKVSRNYGSAAHGGERVHAPN